MDLPCENIYNFRVIKNPPFLASFIIVDNRLFDWIASINDTILLYLYETRKSGFCYLSLSDAYYASLFKAHTSAVWWLVLAI